jgi:chromosome segregation ATPase
MRRVLFQFGVIFILAGVMTANANEPLGFFSPESINLINIFEVVVAGIVASAIVLAILVLFIGQWSGRKQNAAIKIIRKNIEKEEEVIQSSVANVDKNTVKIQQLLNNIEKKSAAITSKQHQAWIHAEDLEEMLEDATEYSAELQQNTEHVNQRMNQIQAYWDGQLTDTADVVERVQSTLEQGLQKVESGLEELQQNEVQSRAISQKIIEAYSRQASALAENSSTSNDIKQNLQKAFEESKHLLQQLDEHKETANKSFQQFNNELGDYESQAYEQFDGAFQATDIARKELVANVNESRQHIDNLRRYESEGRNIKLQASDHLESMNNKSMEQFATTLENTQQMFATLQNDIQDAQYAIDTLRKMKKDVSRSSIETESLAKTAPYEEAVISDQTHLTTKNNMIEEKMEYQAVSGDSTLIPFFSFLNKQKKK